MSHSCNLSINSYILINIGARPSPAPVPSWILHLSQLLILSIISACKLKCYTIFHDSIKRTFRIWFQNNIYRFKWGKTNWLNIIFLVFVASLKQIIYNISVKTSQIFIKFSEKLSVGIQKWFKQTLKQTNKQKKNNFVNQQYLGQVKSYLQTSFKKTSFGSLNMNQINKQAN